VIDDLAKLRASLSDMPVPEPELGFEDRVLAIATAAHVGASTDVRSTFRRHSTWWAAALGALAATVACLAVFWKQPAAAPGASVMLALNENREVSVVIDSERDLAGATIRLYVTGSVALAGYEQQHEIEWKTSLTQGANLLSLPVVGRTPGEGSLVAEIEHDGRTRRVSVALHVAARGDDTA
jgi:hypothetical protein